MLIKCPECGKEISDQSKQCIHCGYPLEEVYKDGTTKGTQIRVICKKCGYIAEIDERTSLGKCPLCGKEQFEIIGTYQPKLRPIVECPYCHSTNTTKISATSKAVSTALFGIFGTKRYNQYHCNDCKSDF